MNGIFLYFCVFPKVSLFEYTVAINPLEIKHQFSHDKKCHCGGDPH